MSQIVDGICLKLSCFYLNCLVGFVLQDKVKFFDVSFVRLIKLWGVFVKNVVVSQTIEVFSQLKNKIWARYYVV